MDQMEMWSITDQQKLETAFALMSKIYRSEQGLYKRLEQIRKEREILTAILEDINYNQIYGKAKMAHNEHDFLCNGSEHD